MHRECGQYWKNNRSHSIRPGVQESWSLRPMHYDHQVRDVVF